MADAYSALVLASSPIVYYRLSDTTTAIADSSGNGHGMTAGANVALQTTGLLNQGVSTNKAVTLPSNNTLTAANSITSSGRVPALEVTNALTIEFWFKPNVILTGATQQDIVYYGSDAGGAAPYGVYTYGAIPQFGFQITAGGTVFFFPGGPTLVVGTRYHVVCTFDGTTQRMYVNGVQQATNPASGTIGPYGANGLCLGNDPSFTDDNAQGVLDEVAIYATVLSAATILQHFNTGNSPSIAATDTAATLSETPTPAKSVTKPVAGADTDPAQTEAATLSKGAQTRGISGLDTNIVSESATATDVIFDPTAGPEHAATVTEAPTLAKAGTPKAISAAEAAAAVTESAAATDVIFDPLAGPEHAATVTEIPVTPDTRPAPLTDTGAAVSEAPTAKVVRRVAAADTEPVSADAPTVTDPQKHVTQAEVGATVSEAPAPKDVHKIAATEAAAAVTETPTVTRVTKTVSAADTDPTISEAPGFRQVHGQPAADTIAPTTEAPSVRDVRRIAATDVDPAFSEIISARDATRLLTDTGAAISEAAALRDTHKIAQAEAAAAVTEAATLGPVKARAATDTDPATSEAATARDVRQPTISETLAPETEAPKLADVRGIAAAEAAAAVTEAPTAFAAAIPHTISEPETGAAVTEAPDLGKTAISGHSVTETEAPTTEAPTLADVPSTLPPPQPPAPVVITPASWSGFRRVTDFSLNFGGDLTPASNGDFGVAQDAVLSKQRVIRRLINNSRQVVDGRVLPADYIYHQDYGASLGRKVGSDVGPSDASTILAYIRTTMRGEDSVDLTQPVNVDTTIVSGGVRLQISYTSAGKVITLPAVVVS